jgi:hypothetical protein
VALDAWRFHLGDPTNPSRLSAGKQRNYRANVAATTLVVVGGGGVVSAHKIHHEQSK